MIRQPPIPQRTYPLFPYTTLFRSFVFLDETGATTNMVRRYGWGPKGERLVDAAPHGHWRTTTPDLVGGRLFVAGLRATGIIAPLVLDGPMIGDTFRAGARPREGGGRAVPGTGALAGRCGRHGQPRRPQGRRRPRRDRRRRRPHPLPAALLAGPEPARANVRQEIGRAHV